MGAFLIVLTFVALVYLAVNGMKDPRAAKTRTTKRHRITELPNGGVEITMNLEHGSVGDKHYTDTVEDVRQLKREGNNEEAIALLLKAVKATEKESEAMGSGWGVAPWYYEQLAIVYRKEGRLGDEVAILERYARMTKAPGAGPGKLNVRLAKAKELLKKRGGKDGKGVRF